MFDKRLVDYLSGADLSLKEVGKNIGFRVSKPINYFNRNLYFLDLTSFSDTGTFKDIVGCHVISECIDSGIREFITQSSGNTANSIAYYASKFKIKCIIVYPKASRYKINNNWYDKEYITFIEVDLPNDGIKHFTESLALELNLPWLPDMSKQISANKFRADFLNDFIKTTGTKIHYTSQAISSGSGIFGLYEGFDLLGYRKEDLPSFIGVQQAAVNPYRRFIYNEAYADDPIIEPTLYRKNPGDKLLVDMKKIIDETNGMIKSISFQKYNDYESDAIHMLHDSEIEITRIDDIIIEKAGILSLIGVLDLINEDRLPIDKNILVTVTGGTAKGQRNKFIPELTHDSLDKKFDLSRIVREIEV